MRCWHLVALAACVAALPQEKVNQDALVLQDFNRRVADYVKLHNVAKSQVHGLKPTKSPQDIVNYEHWLAHRIREMRRGVRRGNVFTPQIAGEFRRLIAITMLTSEGARIRESLRWDGHAAPAKSLRIDRPYPDGAPLPATPPSLLLNLPPLPPELEYRVVGRALVLRDVDANLVVDLVWNALP